MFDMSSFHYYTHLTSEDHRSTYVFKYVLRATYYTRCIFCSLSYIWHIIYGRCVDQSFQSIFTKKKDPEDSSQVIKEAILLHFLVLSTSHRNFDLDVAVLNNDKLKSSLFPSWKLMWKIKGTFRITSIHYVLK